MLPKLKRNMYYGSNTDERNNLEKVCEPTPTWVKAPKNQLFIFYEFGNTFVKNSPWGPIFLQIRNYRFNFKKTSTHEK